MVLHRGVGQPVVDPAVTWTDAGPDRRRGRRISSRQYPLGPGRLATSGRARKQWGGDGDYVHQRGQLRGNDVEGGEGRSPDPDRPGDRPVSLQRPCSPWHGGHSGRRRNLARLNWWRGSDRSFLGPVAAALHGAIPRHDPRTLPSHRQDRRRRHGGGVSSAGYEAELVVGVGAVRY